MPETSFAVRLASVALLAAVAAGCGPGSGSDATYNIVIALSESPSDLQRLSFTLGYTNGDIVGTGSAASCTLADTTDGQTVTLNDNDTTSMTASIKALSTNLVAGDNILTCKFLASTQPTSANFTFTVTSAEDDFGDAVAPADITLVVTSTEVVATLVATVGEVAE